MLRLRCIAGACLTLVALGCEKPGATAAAPTRPPAAEPAPAGKPSAALSRIVFVDQVEACDCTRKRIQASWDALQAALAGRPGLPVERIHMDQQAEAAQIYLDLAPTMVTPGIYFMDARENLAEQLQGEITQAQIAAVLSRG
jgi:hypothetical protein